MKAPGTHVLARRRLSAVVDLLAVLAIVLVVFVSVGWAGPLGNGSGMGERHVHRHHHSRVMTPVQTIASTP